MNDATIEAGQADALKSAVFAAMRRKLDDGKDANFLGVLVYATHVVVDAMRNRGIPDVDIRSALLDGHKHNGMPEARS